jgi:hypothetical protein
MMSRKSHRESVRVKIKRSLMVVPVWKKAPEKN